MLNLPTQFQRCLIAFALLLTTSLFAQTQQFRGAWADVFHVGMGSEAEVDTMVSSLVAGNHNAIVVQVLGYMDTNLPSHGALWKSAIVPWSVKVTESFDPLAYLCQKAHENGIEVHAWLGGSGTAMYRVSNVWPPPGNATLAAHPEWFMVPHANSEGGSVVGYLVNTTTYYALDMGSSDAQEYLVSIIRELVTNYPIDGIHWDDEFDGPTYTTGAAFPAYPVSTYPNSGLGRYRRNTGYVGTPAATDATYNNYRRRFKAELLARCQAEIQSIKTNPRQPLRHSAATMTYGSAPSTCDFTGTTSYIYYSDWAGMLLNGWLDTAIPMNYKAEPSTSYRQWCDRTYSCWRYNRDVFMGLGGGSNAKSNLVIQLQYAFSTNGYKGACIYSYAGPCNDGGNWWTYAAANIYTNTATVPSMPWRNPATATEGLVWGRVRNAATGAYLDDAIVTVAGRPAVRTDGNGYYVATRVPATAAGTPYSITASKTGLVSQTNNAVVLAGDVVRYDFALPVGPTAPTNLTATVYSYAQINLNWTDTATNETGFIVARGTTSAGPFTDIAGLPVNSTSFANTGLAQNTTYYYVVRATNTLAASVNSPVASAMTPVSPFPTITNQPQSQTVVVGTNTAFSVATTGSLPLSFQWRFNGVSIPKATATTYTINSAQYSNGGTYSVVVTNSYGSVTSAPATLTVLSGLPTLKFTNIWNIAANSRDYVTSTNTERGICINPITDHVLLVSRSPLLANNLGIFILNANTGAEVGTMNTNGITNSAIFVLNKIDVADDGVIYGGNLTIASSTSPYFIYRWQNESAIPTVAYSDAPDNGVTARWGDSFSVTGGGVNTRILVSGSGATNSILFTTPDGTNFVANKLNPIVSVTAGEFSKGLHLVSDTVFYSKIRSGTGRIFDYDLAANTASSVTNMTLDFYLMAIAVVTNHNLLAGISDNSTTNNSGHVVKIYDLASPTTPVLLTNFNFRPFGSQTNSPNSNVAGGIDTDGRRIFALDTQNGVVALQILATNPAPHINAMTVLSPSGRRFQLNADPGPFVIQASSDFTNWTDLPVTRTNELFDIVDPATNLPMRIYRTKH